MENWRDIDEPNLITSSILVPLDQSAAVEKTRKMCRSILREEKEKKWHVIHPGSINYIFFYRKIGPNFVIYELKGEELYLEDSKKGRGWAWGADSCPESDEPGLPLEPLQLQTVEHSHLTNLTTLYHKSLSFFNSMPTFPFFPFMKRVNVLTYKSSRLQSYCQVNT